jgi:ATP-dependent DNA helicase RecG
MVNLNLIDTIGSGIKKMFIIQKNKFFPLPEYELSNESVKVTIEGKVLDVKYASKLSSMPDLSLEEIILLDKVQKGHALSANESKILKDKNLIEGKRPNLHISSNVAKATNQEDEYIKLKGINDDYAKTMMIEYLKISKKAKKADFVKAFLDKLPDVLTVEQKQNKIKNYLQELRLEGLIVNNGKYWEMAKN